MHDRNQLSLSNCYKRSFISTIYDLGDKKQSADISCATMKKKKKKKRKLPILVINHHLQKNNNNLYFFKYSSGSNPEKHFDANLPVTQEQFTVLWISPLVSEPLIFNRSVVLSYV